MAEYFEKNNFSVAIIVRHFYVGIPESLPRIALELGKRLSKKGKVFLITDGPKKKHYSYEGIEVYHLPKGYFKFYKQTKKLIHILKPQIIQFLGSLEGAILLKKSLKDFKQPFFLYLTNLLRFPKELKNLRFREIIQDKSRLWLFFRRYLIPKFLIRGILKQKNIKVILPSEKAYRRLLEISGHKYKERIKILKMGVDFNKFNTVNEKVLWDIKKEIHLSHKNKILLYLGHCYASRGINELVKAFNILTKEFSELKLILVIPKTKPSKIIEEKILKLGLKEKTRIVRAHVKNPQDFLQIADLICLPYKFSGEIPDTPLVLLESMAATKPIITTNVGALDEVAQDQRNCLIVKPGDIKSLIKAIKKLLADSTLAKKLAFKASNKSREFDWSHIVNQLLNNFKSALEKQTKGISYFFDKFSYRYEQEAFKQSLGVFYLSQIETNFIKNHLKMYENFNLLDLGSGSGRNIGLFLEKNIKIIGLDFSKEIIKVAQKKFSYSNIKFILADINKQLPLADNSSDGAICFRVLKYVLNWKNVIKELKRVIKPNGQILIEIPNLYSISYFTKRKVNYSLFKLKEVKEILEKNDLKIIEIKGGKRLPFPIYQRINSNFCLKLIKIIEGFINYILPDNFLVRNFMIYCQNNK